VIGDNNRGLTKLCSECQLIDVIYDQHRYGTRDFNSYARGTTCIDYVLMDERLVGSIQACRYLPFNHLLISDHRGLYVDVNTTWFFGSDTIPHQQMAVRDYNSKNIHQTAPFITGQYKHLDDHGWFQHVQQIQQCIKTNTPNHELVERADNRRIEACQNSGKRLKRYGPTPYSPQLIQMKLVDKVTAMII
jgi:hypothetical protein